VTVEEVRRVQKVLGLLDTHLVYVDAEEGFWMAHTQQERESVPDLHECRIHRYLCREPIVVTGWYIIEEDGSIGRIDMRMESP
jgi:hypothetical protein